MNDEQILDAKDEFFQELVQEKSPLLFCDYCGFYPIQPEHAHFRCPSCKMRTSCCEGGALDV